MIGWIVGPLWAGATVLRPEYFSMLALPRRRLAVGVLAAGFVGIGATVTLISFLSLISYAARLGPLPALVAIPAVLFQLLCVMLLSKVAAAALAKVARGRIGAALNGVLVAIVLVVSQSGWMVVVGLVVSGVWERGFPAGISAAVRLAPSGWGLVAVEAVNAQAWGRGLGALAALLVLNLVLLALWVRTLDKPRDDRPVIRGSRRTRPSSRVVGSPTTAVMGKELRTWWRDPARITAISGPVAYALVTAVLPLTFGETLLLPWAAPLIALMAATFMANLYAYDGTALWLTLQTDTQRPDLRARQYVYLLVFAPIALLVAVGFTAWSGQTWAWPWVLALLPAMLGGGAGLIALFSVLALAPGPDPHHRAEHPSEASDDIGSAFVVFFLGLLPPLPAAAVLTAGTVLGHPWLIWAGIPVGLATGVLLTWWLGRIAYRRLEARGPELLLTMRSGRPDTSPDPDLEIAGDGGPAPSAQIQLLGWTLGSLALFPQGLVPVVLKLTGNTDVTVWFLAMYLPEPAGWATALAMIALGLYLYRMAITDLRQSRTRTTRTRTASPERQSATR
jgi:ABC-2 type transport system permease protein